MRDDSVSKPEIEVSTGEDIRSIEIYHAQRNCRPYVTEHENIIKQT